MRVTLAAARSFRPSDQIPATLLEARGASVLLGAGLRAFGMAAPIVPAATTLFARRGACLAGPDGPLNVCDTGHHRLLVWRARPRADHVEADLLIGQPDFASEKRTARTDPSAATLNVPTGVAANGGVLAVADAWNHRVLIWHRAPARSNQAADVVLGQADFAAVHANRGADRPSADTLHWCYGVALDRGRLFVADTGNRRVLVWNRVPERAGEAADLVLGQRDFTERDENAGAGAGAIGMRWPHGIAICDEALLVADAGNNRVMVWRELPRANGSACDYVLGQRDVLLGFDRAALAMNGAAGWLSGQERFEHKGDNRWRAATRDSLCWPYGVAAVDDTLVVADAGNDRVLLWEAAP
jgi:NHL repeat